MKKNQLEKIGGPKDSKGLDVRAMPREWITGGQEKNEGFSEWSKENECGMVARRRKDDRREGTRERGTEGGELGERGVLHHRLKFNIWSARACTWEDLSGK